jgi:hypothetical protein
VNRRFATIIAAGAAGAFALALPLHALPKGTAGYNTSNDTVMDCGNGRTLTLHGPADLWPPNHKYYTAINVTAVDPNGGSITLTTDGTHDQYDGDTEANGSGHTADDIRANDAQAVDGSGSTDQHPVAMETADGTVRTDWEARAERAGTIQDGRTYTLTGTAKFDDGTNCTDSITMHVPHDMRPSNR